MTVVPMRQGEENTDRCGGKTMRGHRRVASEEAFPANILLSTCSLQDCEKINFFCLGHMVYVL